MDPFVTPVIERLVIVETLTAETRADVSEIKADVKALLGDKNKILGAGIFVTRAVAFMAMVFAGASLTITILSKGFLH